MTTYKKQLRYIIERGGGQGFAADIKYLTEWIDEDIAPSLKQIREKHKDDYGWITVLERFVKI